MTRVQASELFAILVMSYNPNLQMPEKTQQIYERMFLDLDHDLTQHVVFDHIASHKYFPRVSEIRERVAQAQVGAPPYAVALAQLEAAERPLHALILEAQKLCGGHWERTHTTNPSAWRAQFRELYQGLCKVAVDKTNSDGWKGLAGAPGVPQLENSNA